MNIYNSQDNSRMAGFVARPPQGGFAMGTGGGYQARIGPDPTMGPLGKLGTAPGFPVNNSPMFGAMAGTMRWGAPSPHGGGPRVPNMRRWMQGRRMGGQGFGGRRRPSMLGYAAQDHKMGFGW